jgi:basic membrane lipoprotein Med (substrate-binding protein (PBP1-ABC) superfamily)
MTSLVTSFNTKIDLFGAPAQAFLPFVLGDDGQSLYDTIYITSDIGSADNAAILKNLVGPQTNVFYCSAPRQKDLSILSEAGVGVYWAELYQARYLNGIIAGLMLPPASDKKSKVCYVKAYREPENNLALNAFAYGLSKTRPDVK